MFGNCTYKVLPMKFYISLERSFSVIAPGRMHSEFRNVKLMELVNGSNTILTKLRLKRVLNFDV